MNSSIRDLYQKILASKDTNLYNDVIKKWVIENEYKEYLTESLQQYAVAYNKDFPQNELWELYALTRVLDVLTLSFQDDNANSANKSEPKVSIEEYIAIVELLGLEVLFPSEYHAFNCEIFEAKKKSGAAEIVNCLFPAVKFGDVMIKRAGVHVALDADRYNVGNINKATMYWAHWRKNRNSADLSDGWGGNSQWRTMPRLDIENEEVFIYNPQGSINLSQPTEIVMEELRQQGLSLEEAVELTKYRQFVSCEKEDDDLSPYNFTYTAYKDR
ncbi:MAG: hypothetical protein R2800_02270 [Flavipsychrobacter sp.]